MILKHLRAQKRSFGLVMTFLMLTWQIGQPLQAATIYWDTNGTTAGSGAATGTWGTSAFWSTDSTGASATANTTITNVDDVVFSAGTNGTTGTVTISGAQVASSITFDDNVAITMSGGTSITIGGTGASQGVFVASGNNAANTISTALILNGNNTIQTAGTGVLTLSGGITGTGNLTLNNNSTNAAGITISTVSLNNTGTITNSGSGSGTSGTTISAVIGSSVTGITQNSATSQLTISGNNNAYAGGVTINAGTVSATTSLNALGTTSSIINLGATSGSADATLNYGLTGTWIATPINVRAGSSGVLTIKSSADTPTVAGAISLSNNLTLSLASNSITFSGGMTGTGNVNIVGTAAKTLTISTTALGFTGNLTNNYTGTGAGVVTISAPINITGSITNNSTGSSAMTLSGIIANSVTGITQNSATSAMTLSGNNSAYTGPVSVLAGTLNATTSLNALGIGSGVITLGNSSGSANSTLVYGFTGTWATKNITVASGNTGTATIQASTDTPVVAGAITLNNNLTIGLPNNSITISGGISGTGNLTFTGSATGKTATVQTGALSFTGNILNNLSGGTSAVTISSAVNTTGTITSTSASSGATTISGIIANSVTGITQNSATSAMTLSGNNSAYTGPVSVLAGTLNATTSLNALGIGAGVITLGNSSGSANSTLVYGLTGTWATKNITVASGNTGTATIQASVDTPVVAGAITLNNNLTIGLPTNNITFSGGITGTGNLNFTGTATKTLTIQTGALGFTGNITNNLGSGAGVVTISSAVNTTGSITNNSASSATFTLSGVIGSTVTGITQNSATSSITLSGANTTYAGGVTINAGTVIANTSSSALGTGTVLLGNTTGSANATLASAAGTPTFANNITVQAGSSGTKTISNTAANNVAFTGGTITLNDNLTLSNTSTAILTIGSVIQGAFDVAISGSNTGTISMTGLNTYSGNTTLSTSSTTTVVAGVSSVGPAGSPTSGPFGTGTLNLSGAQMRSGTGAPFTVGNAVNLSANTTFIAATSEKNLTFTGPVSIVGGTKTLTSTVGTTVAGTSVIFSGVISDGGSAFGLAKAGAGNLTLTGANTYTGPTTISAGTLITNLLADGGTASGIGQSSNTSTNLVLGGGTLQYTGAAQSTNRLFDLTASSSLDASGTGAVNFTNTGAITYAGAASARTLTLTGSSTLENIFNPTLADSGTGANLTSLTKTGAGVWVLNGTNTYTGATTVSAGVLDFARTSAKPSGSTVTGAPNAVIALGVGGSGFYSSANVDSLFADTLSGFSRSGAGVGVDTTNNGGTFTYGTNVTTTTGLAKLGTGTWALTGTVANSQAVTYVTGGTLDLSGATLSGGTYSTPTLIINSGASLLLPAATTLTAGTGTTGAATTVNAMAGSLSGSINFIYSGTGTQSFTGTNTYTGTTAVNSGLGGLATTTTTAGIGTILLDFSAAGAPSTDILYNGVTANTLTLGGSGTSLVGGGRLSVTGASAATNAQTFGGLNLSGGQNTINLTQNGATSLTLNLGAITRSVSATLDFTAAPSAAVIATTSSGTASQILTDANGTAYATVGGLSSWAAKDGSGNIIDLTNATTGYTASTATTASGNADIGVVTTLAAPATLNSLRMGANLTLATGTNVVTTGGVLFTAASTLTGGTLTPGTGNELVFISKGVTGTITSVLADGTGGATSVTYRGPAAAIGTGAFTTNATQNTYTGNTYIQAGRVTTTTATTPFGTGSVYINGNTNGHWYFNGAATVANNLFITGNGWAEGSGPFGAIRMDSGATLSGTVTLLGDSSIGTNSGIGTISGQVTGGFGLTKLGAGQLNLTNTTNNWTGNTTVTGGTGSVLNVAFGALPGFNTSGKVSVSGTGTALAFMTGGPSDYTTTQLDAMRGTASVAGTVSFGAGTFLGIDTTNATSGLSYGSITNTTVGALGLNKLGTGILTLTGTNTYTGGTTVSAGVLSLTAALPSTGTLLLNGGTLSNVSGGTITNTNVLNFNVSSTLAGTSPLAFTTGAGTVSNSVTLTNNNTAGVTFSNAVNINTKTLTVNGVGNTTFSGVLSGGNASTLVYSGTGTLTLSGTNTYAVTTATTAATTATSGVIIAQNTAAFGAAANLLVLGGGTVDLQTNTSITAYNTSLTASSILLSDKATPSSAGITHTLGTLALNTATTTLTVAPGTNVSGGSPAIAFGAATMSLAAGSTYTINPINGASVTLASVANTSTTAASTNTLVLSGNSTGNAITGVIANNGTTSTTAITKSGASTWTLGGVNTFSGALTLQGGTLALDFTGTGTTVGGAAATTLSIGGNSTLNFLGKTGGASAQTWASLTTTSGGGSINFGNANGGIITITSATVTTAAGNSLNINYNQTGGTNGSTIGNNQVVFTTAPTLTNSILVGSTANTAFTVTDVGGSGFATVNGSRQVIRLTGQAGLPRATGSATTNYAVSNAFSTTDATIAGSLIESLTATTAANTVTIDTTGLASGAQLNLGGSTFQLQVATGLLLTGANPYTIFNAGTGGLKGSGTNTNFTINNFGTGGLTLNAPILVNGSGGIVFNGTGTTTLNNASTTTGNAVINGGTVKLGNATALGTTAITVNMTGGTLDLNGISPTIRDLTGLLGSVITDNSAGTGTSTLTVTPRTTATPSAFATTVRDGATQKVALSVAGFNNTTSDFTITGPNTFSGGLTIPTGRVVVNTATTPSATPGTGTITIGSAANSTAQLFYTASTITPLTNNLAIAGIGVTETNGPFGALRISGPLQNTATQTGTITLAANATIGTGGAANTAVLGGKITGSFAPTFYGGTLILTNTTSDYTGNTVIGAGNAVAQTLATVLKMGAANVIPNGTGKGDVTFGQSGTSAATATWQLDGYSQTINGLSNTTNTVITPVIDALSGTPTLTVGNNDATATYAGILQNAAGSVLSFTKIGTGTQTLSGVNTFNGSVAVQNGTLSVTTLNSVDTNVTLGTTRSASSSLGAPLTVALGTIALGSTTTTGGLTVTGTGETTDRVIDLAGTTGGATLTQSGAGLLKFTSPFTATGAGSKTLTLAGSTTGAGEIVGAITNNSLSNTTALTKTGTGQWTLGGNNTYTGATIINGGTLVLDRSGANLGQLTSDVSVAGGATFLVRGSTSIGNGGVFSIAGGATVGTAGALSMADTVASTLTVNGGLSFGTGANGSQLYFDLGSVTGSNDFINASGAATVNGTSTINLAALSLASGSSSYTLITAAGGGFTAGGSGFTLGTKPAGFNTFTLANSTTNSIILDVTANAAIVGNAYWTGIASADIGSPDASNFWGYGALLSPTKSNWSSAADGSVDALQTPSSVSDVIFTASNVSAASVATTLDTNYSVKSLTFNTASPITTASIATTSGSLTLGTGGLTVASTNSSTASITGAGSVLIGANQTWANASGTDFTVSAPIAGTAAPATTQTLTVNNSGAGKIVLGSALTNGAGGGTMALAVTGGTLALTTGGSLSSSTPLSVSGATSVFNLGSFSTAAGNLVLSSAGTIQGSGTLTVNSPNTITLQDGTLSAVLAGSAAASKTTSGTVTLSGNNSTFSGTMTVSAGTLKLGNANALGVATAPASMTTIASGGTVDLNGLSIAENFGNGTGGVLGTGVGGNGAIINSSGTAAAITGTISNGASAFSVGGSGDISLTRVTGSSGLTMTKVGSNTVTLAGNADNSSLALTVSTGTVILAKTVGGGVRAVGGALTVANGATLKLSGSGGDQIFNGGTTTAGPAVAINGTFDLNGLNETISAFSGASTGSVTNTAASTTSVLSVGGANDGGTGANGGGNFAGIISDGASGTGIVAISKNGSGTITLSGPNTYSGATVAGDGASNGVLVVANNTALGNTTGGTTINGFTASSGAGNRLDLANGITVAGEALTMTSASGMRGSLYTAGTATWAGNVTLNGVGSTAFWSDAVGSSLTIGSNSSNTVTSTATSLGLRGSSGAGFINSALNLGSGGLSKTDSGTWTINSMANDFTGGLTVSTGTLIFGAIANGGSNSSIGAGTTIAIGQNAAGSGGLGTIQFTGASGGSSNRTISIVNGASGGSAAIENTVLGQTLTLSGDVTTLTPASASALTLQGAGNGILSGSITGSPLLSFTKAGAGTWTLSGNNTYTGTTTLSAGVLNLGSGQTGSGGPLGGSGTVGSIGIISFTGGTLQYSVANQVDYSSRFSSSAGQAFNIDTNGQNVTFGSQIIGSANNSTLTKLGSGTLSLNSAVSRYTGATTITGGVLSVGTLADGGVDSSIGTSTNAASNLVFNGGMLKYTGGAQSTNRLFDLKANGGIDASGSGALQFTNVGAITTSGTASARTLTLSGTNTGNNVLTPVIANSGTGANSTSIVKDGAGTWVLAALNTYTGATTVNAGILKAGTAQAFGVNSAVSLANTAGATLDLNNNNNSIGSLAGGGTTGGNVALGSATLTTGGDGTSTSYAGVISSTSGGLTKVGNGTLTLGGLNTYAGATAINAGTLQVGVANALPSGSAVTVANTAGAILDLNNNNQTIASLAGAGTTGGAVTLGTAVLTTGDATSTTFNGSISGSGSSGLTKQGVGAFTLGANSSLTGPMAVNVNAGNLFVNGTAGSDVAVTVGNTATLGGTGTISGQVTINHGGIIQAGQSGAGSLTTGDLIFGSTAGNLATANFFNIGGGTPSILNVANLTANGGANTVTFNATTSGLGNTSYALVNYSGVLTGWGASALDAGAFKVGTITGLNGRQSPSLTKSDTAILLTISGDAPKWTGYDALNTSAQDLVWHIPAGGANQNWELITGHTPTDYQAGDAVLFDDSAGSGNTTVNINEGNVLPTSVTINNSLQAYIFNTSGGYAITGATSIVKNGSNSATFNNSNSFSGGLTINAGSVILNAANTFTGGISINGAGVLTLGAASAVGAGNALTFGASSTGQLNLNGNDATLTGLSTNATPGTPVVQNNHASAASVLTINLASGTNAFAGVLQNGAGGTLGLTKTGGGILVLTGLNTLTGGNAVTGGTLQIGSGSTTGELAGATALSSSTALIFNRSDASSYAGAISGSGAVNVQGGSTFILSGGITGSNALTAQGGGTLTLTGDAAHTGGTTIAASTTLQIGDGGATGALSGTGTIANAGFLMFNRTGSTTVQAAINGLGNLSVGNGSTGGTLILTGANGYAGTTTINANGTLQIGGGGTTGTLGTAASVTNNGTLAFSRSDAISVGANITGGGSLNALMTGSGSLSLTGTNTYSGGTNVLSGSVILGSATAFPTNTGVTIGSTGQSATFNLNGRSISVSSLATAGTAANQTITNTSTTTSILTYNSASSSTFGGNVVDGSATQKIGVTITGGGTLQLAKTNAYTGGTIVTNGTAQLGADNAFGTGSLTLGGTGTMGILDLNGFNQSISAYAVGAGGVAANQVIGNSSTSANGTLTYTGANLSFAGLIQDTLGSGNKKTALTLSGNGTFTVTGANTYSGTTTIGSTATLQLGNGGTVGNIGAGPVSVDGALRFNRTNTYTLAAGNLVTGAGSVTLANAGAVATAVDGQFNTTGVLNFGTSNASNIASSLDLTNGSSTFGSLLVQTNTAAANTITIGSGKTLTVNGNVTVGVGGTGTNNRLTVSATTGNAGTGSWVVAGGTTFSVGGSSSVGSTNTLDMRATGLELGTFTAGAVGTPLTLFRIGSTDGGSVVDTNLVKLANTSTITATTMDIGGSTTHTSTNTLTIGTGSGVSKTTFNANTINIGSSASRGSGAINFADPSLGELKIRAADGTSAATLNLVNTAAATGSVLNGDLLLAGHSADVLAGAVTMQSRTGATVTTTTSTSTLTFDAGSFTSTSLVMANRASSSVTSGNMIANATFGGGTTNLGTVTMSQNGTTAATTTGASQSTLTFNGNGSNTITSLSMGNNATTASTASGNPNITDATLNLSGTAITTITGNLTMAINAGTAAAGATTAKSTISLSGGSLTVNGDIAMGDVTVDGKHSTNNVIDITGGTLTVDGNVTRTQTIAPTTGTQTAAMNLNGGTLNMTGGNIGGAVTVTLNAMSGTLQNVGQINGGAGLTKTAGAGTNILILEGSNTYTGNTVVNSGTLQLGSGSTTGTMATTSQISVASGATFAVKQSDIVTQGTEFSSAAITGQGGFAQTGTGTTILNVANSYEGTTTISAGTLQVGNGTSGSLTGAGNVNVTYTSGTATKLSGSGSIAGGTILGSGTVLAPGVGSNTDTDNRTLTFTAAGTAVEVQNGGQIQLGLTSSTRIDSGFDWVANDANTYLNTLTANGTNFTNLAYTTNWQNAESTYDSIKLTNGIFNLGVTTGGTVKVLDNSAAYTLGNIFKLLDWSTVGTADSLLVGSGGFTLANLNLDSVALGSGLAWDTSAFTTYGVIVIVPEPSRVLFLMLGLLGLLMRRRR